MNLHQLIKSIALVGFLSAAHAGSASPVDITMTPTDDGQLAVKLRPSTDFDGLFSSLVFTIRWDASTDAHLGTIAQIAPASTYIPVSRSGQEQDADGERYQIFVGFGYTPLQWIPTNWVAGVEYTIMTIPVEGAAAFELVDDSWTGNNNADYYLALGGLDETGIIYSDITTGITEGTSAAGTLQVLPNPTDKLATIFMKFKQPQDVDLELTNSAGQRVWQLQLSRVSGIIRQPLDLTPYDKGVYLLHVRTAGQVMTERIVKR
ncbi:MAG: T9SS type A sorting domain-containing protein [Flavobacteriales bacterium]